MAEIQSKEEEDLLDQFLLSEVAYAIGLNDIAHEGIWEFKFYIDSNKVVFEYRSLGLV